MIKNILFSLAFLFLFGNTLRAQQTEGFVQYAIKITPLDTTLATRQKAGMFIDSKMLIYFSPEFSRLDFYMGKMMESKTIIDNVNKKGITLNKNPYAKMGMYLDENEILGNPGVNGTTDVKLIDETKVILGFTCKKAIVTLNGVASTYWYTTAIKVDNNIAQQIINKNIPGFPLYFSSETDGVLMEFQASNFEKVITDKASVFSMAVPEGYIMK